MSEPEMKVEIKKESLEDSPHSKEQHDSKVKEEKEKENEQLDMVSLHSNSSHGTPQSSRSLYEKSSQEFMDALDEQRNTTELSAVVSTLRDSLHHDKSLPEINDDTDGFESAMLEVGNRSNEDDIGKNGKAIHFSSSIDNDENLVESVTDKEDLQHEKKEDHKEKEGGVEEAEYKKTETKAMEGEDDGQKKSEKEGGDDDKNDKVESLETIEIDDNSDQLSVDSVPKVTVSEISEHSSLEDNDDEEETNELEKEKGEPGSPIPEKLKVTDIQIANHFENVRKSIDGTVTPEELEDMVDYTTLPPPGLAPNSTFASDHNNSSSTRHSPTLTMGNDDGIDNNASKSSITNTVLSDINLSHVKANTLNPRLQEDYDQDMLKGMQLFFNNKFSEAKSIFETKAKDDPLYALGLGSMAFIKAITSHDSGDTDTALKILGETYAFAHAQVDAASAKKPLKDTLSHYWSHIRGTNPTHLPTNTRPLNKDELGTEPKFMSNGALRAHVIKAECSLLIAMIYLSQETVVGYIKTGLNLRRAYHCYSLVWQEYKRMGQDFNKYMDMNTISAIQFGIGSVHLLLSSLPVKILKIVSAFGWTADKNLGFAFLKLCLEERRVRSPLASLMLLSYYVISTSYAPQILKKELIQPAIECLLDAQKSYPNSAFFLFFAGRVSRLARNLPLSTQSFIYACEVSQGDWAESTMCPLATLEMAMNSAMGLDWASASSCLMELNASNYNSRSFLRFFYGTCQEMLGNRTEAILAFVEAPDLVADKKKKSQLEQFVANRVAFYERSGYQDLDFSLPAFEILLTWNAFPSMPQPVLDQCIQKIDQTLNKIYDREKLEYDARNTQLAPTTSMPDYYDQRGVLLLAKASILNALEQYAAGIVHLNWIIDNKDKFKFTKWLIPFTYWECGNTCWGKGDFERARNLWETALSYSGYEFEYRLATRLNLAITHAAELGIPKVSSSSSNNKNENAAVRTVKKLPPLPSSEGSVNS